MAIEEDLGSVGMDFELNARPFQTGIRNVKKSLGTFMGSIKRNAGVIGGIAAGMSMTIYQGVQKSLMAFEGFDTAIREVATLMNLTNVEFDVMRARMLDFSEMAGKSIVDLTKSLYQAVSASFALADAFKLVDVAVKMARGGITTTEVAIDALTTTMNAWGISIENATQVSDVFFTTVKLGKTRIDELAAGIGMVATLASTFGVSFEEVSAAVATATKVGIKSRLAMNYMKGSLIALGSPTAEARKVMKRLGISFLDTTGKMKPFSEIIEIVRGAVVELQKEGLSAPEAWRKIIPSIEASTLMMVLTANTQDYNDALEEMYTSAGATAAANEKMQESFSEKKARVQASLERVLIEVASQMIPVIESVMEATKKLYSMISGMSSGTKKWIAMIAIAASGLGMLLMPLMSFANMAGMLIPMIAQMTMGMSAQGAAAAAAAGGTTTLTGAVAGLGVALKALLLNPVVLALAALVAGIAIAYVAYKKWKVTTDDVSEAHEKAATSISKVESATAALATASEKLRAVNLQHTKVTERINELREEGADNTSRMLKLQLEELRLRDEQEDANREYSASIDDMTEAFQNLIDAQTKANEIEQKFFKQRAGSIKREIMLRSLLRMETGALESEIANLEEKSTLRREANLRTLIGYYTDEGMAIEGLEANIVDLVRARDAEDRQSSASTLRYAQISDQIATLEDLRAKKAEILANIIRNNLTPAQKAFYEITLKEVSAQEALRKAELRRTDAISTMTDAQNRLIGSEEKLITLQKEAKDLMHETRNLQMEQVEIVYQLEKAEEALTEAIDEFGEDSLEGVQAIHALEKMQMRQVQITDELSEAQKKKQEIEGDEDREGSIKFTESRIKLYEEELKAASEALDTENEGVTALEQNWKDADAAAATYYENRQAEVYVARPEAVEAMVPRGAIGAGAMGARMLGIEMPETPKLRVATVGDVQVNISMEGVEIKSDKDIRTIAAEIGAKGATAITSALDSARNLRTQRQRAGYV